MIVQGVEIKQAWIDACRERMKATEYFRGYEIAEAAAEAGVPKNWGLHGGVAKRVMQLERNAGKIMPVNRRGLWRHSERAMLSR